MTRGSQSAWTRWMLSSLVIVTGFLAAPPEAFGQG
jgi:hypothetical protein